MRAVDSYIRAVAPLAEMDEHEIESLISLCEGLDGYYSYEQLRVIEARLAHEYDTVSHNHIGGSSDYGELRPIGLTRIGNPDGPNGSAYLQGPEHPPELAGSTTIAVLEQFFAQQPRLLRRLGYSGLLASSHIDPDGMTLQSWPLQNATLKQVTKYGYRGSWSDQVSWGYPTEGYHHVSPEVEASLSTINTYSPRFIGSMHAANFAGYVVSSSLDEEIAAKNADVLEESRLPINYDEPESLNDPVLAPGVFGVATDDSYRETRLSENKHVLDNTLDGGTNISQHIPDGTTLIIPETPAIIADPTNDLITDITTKEVIAFGANEALTITNRVAAGLGNLSVKDMVITPESERLHRASRWWCDTVPSIYEGQIKAGVNNSDSNKFLTRAQRATRIGTPIANSLIHAGNVQRLAKMTNNSTVVEKMEHTINDGLKVIGPTQRVEIGMQIAVQVLTILVGMKHAN